MGICDKIDIEVQVKMTVRQDRILAKIEATDDPVELAELKAALKKERSRLARDEAFEPAAERYQLARLVLDRRTELAVEFLEQYEFEDGRRWELARIRRQAICEMAERLGWTPPPFRISPSPP